MLHTIVLLVITTLLYLINLMPDRARLNDQNSRRLLWLVRILCVVVLILLAMETNSIKFRGYWTHKVIIWLSFFTIAFYYVFRARGNPHKAEAFLYRIIFLLPVIVIGFFMLMPLFGGHILMQAHSTLIGNPDLIIKETPGLRLDQSHYGLMGPSPDVNLFLKKGLFEFGPQLLPVAYNSKMYTVVLAEDTKNVTIAFQPTNENHLRSTVTTFSVQKP